MTKLFCAFALLLVLGGFSSPSASVPLVGVSEAPLSLQSAGQALARETGGMTAAFIVTMQVVTSEGLIVPQPQYCLYAGGGARRTTPTRCIFMRATTSPSSTSRPRPLLVRPVDVRPPRRRAANPHRLGHVQPGPHAAGRPGGPPSTGLFASLHPFHTMRPFAIALAFCVGLGALSTPAAAMPLVGVSKAPVSADSIGQALAATTQGVGYGQYLLTAAVTGMFPGPMPTIVGFIGGDLDDGPASAARSDFSPFDQ